MKNIRPLELMILIIAVIVLIASMFAVGFYGPELVKFIQQDSGMSGDSSFSLKIIISRIGDIVKYSFTSWVNTYMMKATC